MAFVVYSDHMYFRQFGDMTLCTFNNVLSLEAATCCSICQMCQTEDGENAYEIMHKHLELSHFVHIIRFLSVFQILPCGGTARPISILHSPAYWFPHYMATATSPQSCHSSPHQPFFPLFLTLLDVDAFEIVHLLFTLTIV